jgi:hypothetical protein
MVSHCLAISASMRRLVFSHASPGVSNHSLRSLSSPHRYRPWLPRAIAWQVAPIDSMHFLRALGVRPALTLTGLSTLIDAFRDSFALRRPY